MNMKDYIIGALCVALATCIFLIVSFWHDLDVAQSHLEFYKQEVQETHEFIKTSEFGQLVRIGKIGGVTAKAIHVSYRFGDEDKYNNEHVHKEHVCYMDRAGHLYFHDDKRCDKCNPDALKNDTTEFAFQLYNAAQREQNTYKEKELQKEIRLLRDSQ